MKSYFEYICKKHPDKAARLFEKYGVSVPVNPETVASICVTEPGFAAELDKAVSGRPRDNSDGNFWDKFRDIFGQVADYAQEANDVINPGNNTQRQRQQPVLTTWMLIGLGLVAALVVTLLLIRKKS